MYIGPGQWRITPGTEFRCQQIPFIIVVQCGKFQKISFFFITLYMSIAPKQGCSTPVYVCVCGGGGGGGAWGSEFYVNRSLLSLWPSIASFKQSSKIVTEKIICFYLPKDHLFNKL